MQPLSKFFLVQNHMILMYEFCVFKSNLQYHCIIRKIPEILNHSLMGIYSNMSHLLQLVYS